MSDINEIKRIVNESRIYGVYNWNLETIASLITTIESQNSQIESLKAITELAVKGFQEIEIGKGEFSGVYCRIVAKKYLSEIERLQNGAT